MAECFDFEAIAARYGDRIAIISQKKKVTYRELAELAREKSQKHHWNCPYVVLKGRQQLEFVVEFLAVHYAKRIPIVVNEFMMQHLEKTLEKIKGRWQLLGEKKENKELTTENNVLFLGLTSGTTGLPKVYCRNWISWRKGFVLCNECFGLESCENIATFSPMATSLGMHTLLLSLYLGKTMYLINKKNIFLDTDTSKTAIFAVPAFFEQKLSMIEWRNVNCLVLCGGILAENLLNKIQQQNGGTDVFEMYGSSETSLISWQKLNREKKENCVGKPFAQVQFVHNQSSLIEVKSPYLFSGYLGCKEKETVVTSDIGEVKEGKVFIYSRQSEVIDHGGNKIFPSEIEKCLLRFVDDAVVFGVPDKKYGERIVALVVCEMTRKKIEQEADKLLEKYKKPQEYIFVSKIPVGPNQKISRLLLAQKYERGELDEI
ncbi:AMP-binding protein [Liquorilactobacillus uvarum]|uniref:AMP-binding protein n=1 Tax=Liquorilactobacillus uvarum TaxID=303240 RepID=UPI00288BA072|nr:AMP-binding protein [Liquorilactobacillus uvarum]